jgi:hypothetical protein
VVIRDTGVGIAPGQIDAMYQPFVRGGSLPSGNFASTALAINGLYSFKLFGREEVRAYVGQGVAWLTEVDIDFEQGGQELSCSGDGRCRLTVLRLWPTVQVRRPMTSRRS